MLTKTKKSIDREKAINGTNQDFYYYIQTYIVLRQSLFDEIDEDPGSGFDVPD